MSDGTDALSTLEKRWRKQARAIDGANYTLTNMARVRYKCADELAAVLAALTPPPPAKPSIPFPNPCFVCPVCGPCVVDEDGCCRTCGADAPVGAPTPAETRCVLRDRVEAILAEVDLDGDDAGAAMVSALRLMLDDVDARDSCAMPATQSTPPPAGGTEAPGLPTDCPCRFHQTQREIGRLKAVINQNAAAAVLENERANNAEAYLAAVTKERDHERHEKETVSDAMQAYGRWSKVERARLKADLAAARQELAGLKRLISRGTFAVRGAPPVPPETPPQTTMKDVTRRDTSDSLDLRSTHPPNGDK